ncbi:hypothetical protein Tco_0702653 [Tanacetum coccineum]|uniref:Uncharacterized protein n=1 Tax=Tanacetum coccineum TaxID=301880 RepID=A0ABQ4XXF8_9ASTR
MEWLHVMVGGSRRLAGNGLGRRAVIGWQASIRFQVGFGVTMAEIGCFKGYVGPSKSHKSLSIQSHIGHCRGQRAWDVCVGKGSRMGKHDNWFIILDYRRWTIWYLPLGSTRVPLSPSVHFTSTTELGTVCVGMGGKPGGLILVCHRADVTSRNSLVEICLRLLARTYSWIVLSRKLFAIDSSTSTNEWAPPQVTQTLLNTAFTGAETGTGDICVIEK